MLLALLGHDNYRVSDAIGKRHQLRSCGQEYPHEFEVQAAPFFRLAIVPSKGLGRCKRFSSVFIFGVFWQLMTIFKFERLTTLK